MDGSQVIQVIADPWRQINHTMAFVLSHPRFSKKAEREWGMEFCNYLRQPGVLASQSVLPFPADTNWLGFDGPPDRDFFACGQPVSAFGAQFGKSLRLVFSGFLRRQRLFPTPVCFFCEYERPSHR